MQERAEEKSIQKVSELLDFLKTFAFQYGEAHSNKDFIFRGISDNSYSLIPKIFREYQEPQKKQGISGGTCRGNIYISHEYEILEHFKKESGAFCLPILQDNSFTWLQYAQHYGVPTRLLDFSENPLVALYFCCNEHSEKDGALWFIRTTAFDRWSESEMICEQYAEEYTKMKMIFSILESMEGRIDYGKEVLEKKRPVLFVPTYIDQRMIAQSSRFLLWGEDKRPLCEMVSKENYMEETPCDVRIETADDKSFLRKLILPAKCKEEILRELDLLGINEKTVFPGLDGVGNYVEQYHRSIPIRSNVF